MVFCCVVTCGVMWYGVVSVVFGSVTLCGVVPRHAMSLAVECCVVSCHVVLCHVVSS